MIPTFGIKTFDVSSNSVSALSHLAGGWHFSLRETGKSRLVKYYNFASLDGDFKLFLGLVDTNFPASDDLLFTRGSSLLVLTIP